MKKPRALSLRSRFTLIVLGGAVLPLALLGLWLTRTAERSGEDLLRARLEISLRQVVEEIGMRWLSVRSELLQLAECPELQVALTDSRVTPASDAAALRELTALHAGMREAVESATIRDSTGSDRWTVGGDPPGTASAAVSRSATLPVSLPIYDNVTGDRLGMLDARVALNSLLPGSAGWGGVSGSVLAVFDPSSGLALLPLSIEPSLFSSKSFVWGRETWITVDQTLFDPPMELVLAASATPFTEPFREAARRNLWILAIVAVTVFALATLLTRRTTGALVRLASAAEAVAQGDLDRKVEGTSDDEVGRVAGAFNSMTESLRRTLRELSQRQALAAVGEFAASMAHEVRNPLTSIRVDLQRVEEKLPSDSDARDLLHRALGSIERVDRSVTGALRVARSGSVKQDSVDLRKPLQGAIHTARPEFATRNATLEPTEPGLESVQVRGDAGALEQLFLNLLLNAAQALGEGGRASVALECSTETVSIVIQDTGRGIAPEDLDKVFDPFYSTRPDGTGLGLAIARQIAVAHGGEVSIHSAPGTGTRVEVVLPQYAGATT